MTIRFIAPRSLLVAGALGTLFVIASAFAQEPQDPPAAKPAAPAPETPKPEASKPMPSLQPQPTTVPRRPDIPNAEVPKVLRGIPPPPFPATEDKLPIPQLKLPKGFKIEVYASGIANARSLRLGDKGTVVVSNRLLDKVYAIVDKSGKCETKVIASGLHRANGLAFHNGTLYMAEGTRISKLERIEDNIAKLPLPATEPPDPSRLERARALIRQHRCNFCHRQDFSGEQNVPRLAGQREDYLVKALREYKSNARRGYNSSMADVMYPVTDADILDCAHSLARLR